MSTDLRPQTEREAAIYALGAEDMRRNIEALSTPEPAPALAGGPLVWGDGNPDAKCGCSCGCHSPNTDGCLKSPRWLPDDKVWACDNCVVMCDG